MKDVLASIPGFGAGRPRKRHNRKLSTAEQLEQTKKEGCIDLETPGSVLTHVSLRAILNKHTFSLLPPLYQFKLLQLLPDVDSVTSSDSAVK
jgi:additional sex combs-like protein